MLLIHSVYDVLVPLQYILIVHNISVLQLHCTCFLVQELAIPYYNIR